MPLTAVAGICPIAFQSCCNLRKAGMVADKSSEEAVSASNSAKIRFFSWRFFSFTASNNAFSLALSSLYLAKRLLKVVSKGSCTGSVTFSESSKRSVVN